LSAHGPKQPTLCVLDVHDVDRLLERLRAFHGEPRADIAPELLRDRLVVYWDCQYATFEACYHLGNILAGNRGFCNLNPWPGPSQLVPYRHQKRYSPY
jgi:hypothetical protein